MMGSTPQQLNNPLIVECDVSKDEEVERMCQEVGQAFGHIDFLIHSIAYAPPQTFEKRFVEVARADFALALDISAYSLIALSRGVLPRWSVSSSCPPFSRFIRPPCTAAVKSRIWTSQPKAIEQH